MSKLKYVTGVRCELALVEGSQGSVPYLRAKFACSTEQSTLALAYEIFPCLVQPS